MPMPLHPLPLPEIYNAYVQGKSYRALAEQYKTEASTIRNRLKRWCEENDRQFPPRTTYQKQNKDTVKSDLIIQEVIDVAREYRISQKELAGICGVSPNYLHQMMCGHKPRIARKYAEKIQAGIEKIENRQAEWDYTEVTLPRIARTHCAKGHRYTGKRDPKTGWRVCVVCLADKHRRAWDAKVWKRLEQQERKSA